MTMTAPLSGAWPPFFRRRVAIRERRGQLNNPTASSVPRSRCLRSQALRKGFGAALPQLPSLGGTKPKVPAGGVPPSPPVDLEDFPAALSRLWVSARELWTRRCIEQPVLLPAHDATVHIVPVGADMPADASLIRDVVAAVQPDAIALESPPQHLKSYTLLARALQPQLMQLLAASELRSGPAAPRAAFSAAQREELQVALLTACRGTTLQPDPDQLHHMFRLGSMPFVEWLVPAHLARTALSSSASSTSSASSKGTAGKQQQPMLLLSCGLDRAARAALPAASLFFGREFNVYLEEVEAALGEEAAGELVAWRTALGDRLEAAAAGGGGGDGGRELATLLAGWEAAACLGPEEQRDVAGRVEARLREERRYGGGGGDGGIGEGRQEEEGGAVALEMVRTPADPVMARRLADLAGGRDVVRRCGRIVAVVGRVHALSVEEELRRLAAAGR